jgi:hypothetical protein
VYSFQQVPIDVVTHCDMISTTSCPMHFSDLELELYREEMKLVEELEPIMQKVEAEHRMPLGGMVRPEHYKRRNRTAKVLRCCVTR